MSCANIWYKQRLDENKKPIKGVYDGIPCGTCPLCRRDTRNMWEDRINYDRQGKSSAFVTFTYDENFIPIVMGKGGYLPTLKKEDFSKFIDRLRAKIAYKLPSELCRKDFTYYGVGEYGDQFGRPHYHVLFNGLDFFDCRKVFQDEWQMGIIDSLPVLEGATRYVLKYVDKQQKGKRAKEMYDDNGIERPFSTMSTGLGAGLFWTQYDYIKQTGNYKNMAGKERPVPQYYKNKIMATPQKEVDRLINKAKADLKRNAVTNREVDNWLKNTLHARAKVMEDLELQSGHAILRTQKPNMRGHTRYLMYKEMAQSWENKAERFNEEIMRIIHEKMQCA